MTSILCYVTSILCHMTFTLCHGHKAKPMWSHTCHCFVQEKVLLKFLACPSNSICEMCFWAVCRNRVYYASFSTPLASHLNVHFIIVMISSVFLTLNKLHWNNRSIHYPFFVALHLTSLCISQNINQQRTKLRCTESGKFLTSLKTTQDLFSISVSHPWYSHQTKQD